MAAFQHQSFFQILPVPVHRSLTLFCFARSELPLQPFDGGVRQIRIISLLATTSRMHKGDAHGCERSNLIQCRASNSASLNIVFD